MIIVTISGTENVKKIFHGLSSSTLYGLSKESVYC